jgi:hypothetical protein
MVGWFMVFNATFNNISVILWQSVLLVEETGENHQPAASHGQILSHNVVSSTPRLRGVQTPIIMCISLPTIFRKKNKQR